jgi:hypothetical protein
MSRVDAFNYMTAHLSLWASSVRSRPGAILSSATPFFRLAFR